MSLDTSSYYRLTNNFLGPGRALDVKPDGSGRLMMAPIGDFSGQFWSLTDLGGARYALHTLYLGECFSLDVVNDGRNDTPCLAATGIYSGQSWSLTQWPDGSYKLSNDFTGAGTSLDVYGTPPHSPFLEGGDHSGQHWTLTALYPIPSTVAIPALDPRGAVYHTEGPSNFGVYARPEGIVRAVMVFVDFPDVPAGSTSAVVTAGHLLGHGRAQKLYYEQSHGKLTLRVDVRADLGWRRMPHPSTHYSFQDFDPHKVYVGEAAALFPAASVNFAAYCFVFIVAPPASAFPLSPAFNAPPGSGAPSPSGEIRLAVTFGNDSYENRYINLVHEVGHLFDLPDLYPKGGSSPSKAGCWDIMSDIFHSASFLGWHRHKNGWLDVSRKTYVPSTSTSYATLSPLSGGCGLSMVVLPVDDARAPSKVFVIELAQPVLGNDGKLWGDGVLLYTVDARVPTLSSPVVVIPSKPSSSPTYGELHEAPFGVGGHVTVTDGTASLSLRVLQKFGSSYNVEIEFRRPSSWLEELLWGVIDVLAVLIPPLRTIRRATAAAHGTRLDHVPPPPAIGDPR